MAYPNYGYNSYGYVPNYAPGYVQPQYATNPYQNMQQPQQAQAIPNTVIPPTTNKRLCISQDDAMSRQVENNSSYVYFDQNKPYVSSERECHYYVELAKAFLEDDDGPEPSEKLALYYYCIAEDE